ncbi:MAG: DUF3108 domain-containing protein [Candidatus Kapaibacterium sp.]
MHYLSFPRKFSRFIFFLFLCLNASSMFAQQKNAVFQTGERLTYKVKYGFIKLGTMVIETGSYLGNSHIKARMKYWTAEVPFLDSKDTIDDVIDTTGICLIRFEEHGYDGKKKISRGFSYDPRMRTLTYFDASISNRVTSDVRPFSDAIALFFNLRTWNGSSANYYFPMRGLASERTVKCCFSRNESMQKCAAFADEEIPTFRIEGLADMGNSTILGADGSFTAFVTKDAAAIPIRVDMKIAIGSITILLDKVERKDWQPLTDTERR